MKTAQSKYSQAGINITLGIYFDLKAFDFITPAMSADEEENFIRLVCDSLVAAMPKESVEKNFYIKKILKDARTNTLKMLCTDGFLIDGALVIPISQQAFAKERIKLTDIDQLPTRLNLSNDLLKNINERLPLFEEEARKAFPLEKTVAAREIVKQDRPVVAIREFATDKAFDVLSEIPRIKKEMREIAENSTKILNSLMEQINGIKKRIHDEVMKETKSSLQFDDNKNKLDDFAQLIVSQAGGGDVDKNKEALTQKINEITPIYAKFVGDLEEISQRIIKQTHTLDLFKQYLINALFESASQYRDVLVKQMSNATPHAKKIMLDDFNKKFAGIAALSDSGELSSLKEAQDALGKLSLDNLQEIISNDDKENPGLLQKCNTSWTEETPELQIVMKNISRLNGILSGLLKDDTQFAPYANYDMIEIIRIPFPRSFQFKFSSSAMSYKKAVEDFGKSQKEAIISMANNYKKTFQIDDIRDKTQRALVEIQKQTEVLKKPVIAFKDLLVRKETSGAVIASANEDHEITEKYINSAKQLQEFMNANIDPGLKSLLKRINTLAQEIRAKADDANKAMQLLINKKSQIDLAINKFSSNPMDKPDIGQLDEKILSMELDRKTLIDENTLLQALNSKLAVYDNLIKISEKISASIAQSNMRNEQNEAKGFLLELIKNQTRDPATTEQLKKQMIEIYTNIDTNVASMDKIGAELVGIKKQIFTDFNNNTDVPTEQLDASLRAITEKLQVLESIKLTINENVSHLRKLGLESTVEKK